MNSKHCGHKKIKRFFASVFILLITVRLAVCLHLFSSLNQPWKIRFNIPNFKLTIFTIFLDGRTFFSNVPKCLPIFFVLPAAVNQKSIPINAQSIPLSIVPDLMPNSIKSHKTSKSRMRAKRATFTFWVDKSSLIKSQKWSICRVFEKLKLAVKQCYQTCLF